MLCMSLKGVYNCKIKFQFENCSVFCPHYFFLRNIKNLHIYLVAAFFNLETFLELSLPKANKYSLKNATRSAFYFYPDVLKKQFC